MVQPPASENNPRPWSSAVKLLTRWLEAHERVDTLLEELPAELRGSDRGRSQSLFLGAVRHFGRIDTHLRGLVERTPRDRLKAILLVSGFELIEGGDEHHTARVVHHAVEQSKTLASAAEARLVNAVVRKLATALAAETEPPKLATASQLATYYSHPEWLVERWLAQFGAVDTRAFLEWNMKPAPVFGRWRSGEPTAEEQQALTPTPWPGFYEIKAGRWVDVAPWIKSGRMYVQDPSTRLAIEMVAPQAGEEILDLCAAPGGKSLAIADRLRAASGASAGVSAGRVVALDLPGERIDRLKENLALAEGVDVALVQADALKLSSDLLKEHTLPLQYAAVLVDAPCSNTGVMRHRVDVKWRLEPGDFGKHARQQLAMLKAAARWVAPGGRLVYSTCSVDAEENDQVAAAFLAETKGRFVRDGLAGSWPWKDHCDGAAAFRFRKVDTRGKN